MAKIKTNPWDYCYNCSNRTELLETDKEHQEVTIGCKPCQIVQVWDIEGRDLTYSTEPDQITKK